MKLELIWLRLVFLAHHKTTVIVPWKCLLVGKRQAVFQEEKCLCGSVFSGQSAAHIGKQNIGSQCDNEITIIMEATQLKTSCFDWHWHSYFTFNQQTAGFHGWVCILTFQFWTSQSHAVPSLTVWRQIGSAAFFHILFQTLGCGAALYIYVFA